MPTKEEAIEALKRVVDPELQLDVWTLGLIYKVDVKEDKDIFIEMTFTSPMCPYAPMLVEDIKTKLQEKGFKEPKMEFTFNPPWEPSDEVKELLGLL